MAGPKEYTRNQVILNIPQLKEKYPNYQNKPPHPHQTTALAKLSERFTPVPPRDHKSGLLVLPTGSGKTFTAINWTYKKIIPNNIKVLWLAHTGFLLSQAADTFYENILSTYNREEVRLRVVSSSKFHDYPKNIDISDDIVIITTQTVIKQLSLKKDLSSEQFEATAFYQWLESCKSSGLLIVLDEAHHAPASGCRRLLLDIINQIPNSFLLGLTATPMHLDPNLSGWIPKFFGKEPIYTVTRDELIHQKILAKPIIEQMETGITQRLTDSEFKSIVEDNKGIPEHVIDNLSKNAKRNEYIVQTYIQNKDKYKKTIIFTDRWYQCEFIENRLRVLDPSIRVKSIYTCSVKDPDADKAYKDPSLNEIILNEFKNGELDVLLNVKILTEGADIPDVNTVFITRQTTSPILLTQMVGRCLRGEKAGGGSGKSDANVVMFIDDWRRLLDFAYISPDGGVDDPDPVSVEILARQIISRKILLDLFNQIDSGIVVNTEPYLTLIPVGWYVVRITDVVNGDQNDCNADGDGDDQSDDLETHTELVMIYEQDQSAYHQFIDMVFTSCPEEWGIETALPKQAVDEIIQLASNYFEDTLLTDGQRDKIIKIARHIAQNNTKPLFHTFEEREQYDLDKIVESIAPIPLTSFEKDTRLQNEYNKTGSFWKVFYQSFDNFKTAYNAAESYYVKKKIGGIIGPDPNPHPMEDLAFTPETKEQIRKRDQNKCRCCGATRNLEVDHIIPVTMGGKSIIENGQLLCGICHDLKGTKTNNYVSVNLTPLRVTKALDDWYRNRRLIHPDPEITLRRIVNNFYECAAVADIKILPRKDGYFTRLHVLLFQGNDPEWINAEKRKMIDLFKNEYRKSAHLQDITFTN